MKKIMPMLAVAALLMSGCAAPEISATKSDILVMDSDVMLGLAAPPSSLILFIPKEGLSLARKGGIGSDSPRYFLFTDLKRGIVLSGWFEPAEKYSSVEKIWAGDTKQWKLQGLPDPVNVSFEKIGRWDAVIYDMPRVKGSETHIRGHWIEAGTWIDVHLSMTSALLPAEGRAKIRSLFESLEVNAAE